MEINVSNGKELVLGLKGRLDTTTSQELSQKYGEIEVKGDFLVFDFSELEYISSAGLRVLLAIKKDLDSKGKKLIIRNINDVVKEVFNVTGFINILNIE